MNRTVHRRLGLDHVAEVLFDQVRRVQVEVLAEERDRLRRALDDLDARIVRLGGRRRQGLPCGRRRTSPTVGEGRAKTTWRTETG